MVKAKRLGEGNYELSYKGKSVTITRRPDLYFDLTLGDQPPVKDYLKGHKARFQAWVDGTPAGAAPQASEPSARRASPVAGSPAQAPERPAGPAFEPVGGKTPASENGVVADDCMVIAFPPAREAVTAEPVQTFRTKVGQTGATILFFDLHEGSSVRVTLGKNAALALLAEIRRIVEPGEE